MKWTRREWLVAGAALGASVAFAGPRARRSRMDWHERRDLYPEGVASGDPTPDSVVLWTRRPFTQSSAAPLQLEVAADPEFRHIVAQGRASVCSDADWTCRVLIGGLQPARVYFYRFSDELGNGSRIGRTITAPATTDSRAIKFAFVSCQNVTLGAQNAYRRMIFEDERAPEDQRLAFVLHLGDFIYELVWYPEDRPRGMYDRRIRDIVRYRTGERIDDCHIPTSVDDYRAVYKAYLHDPDLQDARARWPFVAIWDNHEFSWLGWQSIQEFNGQERPAQTRKIAANQAWFEYQPARVRKPGNPTLERFDPPQVSDAPIERFDDEGLGTEPNNLSAIESLIGYRALRFGKHVELILTDQHSYRSREPTNRREAKAFTSDDFPQLMPEEVMRILDGGRAHDDGHAPETIEFDKRKVPNFRRKDPPQTILGAAQKRWFLAQLAASTATWKIWGNTQGTLDFRVDPQHLPPGLTRPWPGGYAGLLGGDHSTAYRERAEIYDFVRQHGIGGFVTIAGDRHSFWAGLAAAALPPRPFEPVGVAFITGSISAPGIVEAFEHGFPNPHPLRALYLLDRPGQAPEPTLNLLLRHGVRACLEYQRSHDHVRARKLSDRDLAPHLSFVDMGGHGYATVCAGEQAIDVEFVAIPRPIERSPRADGGPLAYRVVHRAPLWRPGERPRLEQQVSEGNPFLSL
jgi:alkaline phosphatase D